MASAGDMQQGMPAAMQHQHQHLGGHLAAVDSLTCQWGDCRERCETPEALYEHVCERHVGRKSTNNLNLQCQWGTCRTTTVKRDHITSHIRVHVPLKPHKCDFCGKSFKRPQDLKKHVKTHADESVLLRTPDPGSQQRSQGSSYQQNPGGQSAYYGQEGQVPPTTGSYQYAPTQGQMSYSMPQTSGHYGSVYYNVPHNSSYAAGMSESKKRTHDALNEFFSDIKKRQVDPGQYQDIGARLQGLMNLNGNLSPGYQAGFQAGIQAVLEETGGGVAVAYGAHPPGFNTSPFSELRSKPDLMSIDHFLEQLQNTVYEHPNQYAQNYQPAPLQVRSAGQEGLAAAHPVAGASPYSSAYNTEPADESTPALTPSSPNASSHSPSSVHATQSSTTAGASSGPPPTAAMYPTLPPVSSIRGSTYPSSTSPSTIAPSYDELEPRRQRGGLLQRAARPRQSPEPQRRGEHADAAKGNAESPTQPPREPVTLPPISSITGEVNDEEASEEVTAKEERQEAWVQNVRIIEALREYVRRRLEKGEYDRYGAEYRPAEDAMMIDPELERDESGRRERGQGDTQSGAESLYPILRAVEARS